MFKFWVVILPDFTSAISVCIKKKYIVFCCIQIQCISFTCIGIWNPILVNNENCSLKLFYYFGYSKLVAFPTIFFITLWCWKNVILPDSVVKGSMSCWKILYHSEIGNTMRLWSEPVIKWELQCFIFGKLWSYCWSLFIYCATQNVPYCSVGNLWPIETIVKVCDFKDAVLWKLLCLQTFYVTF